MAFIKKIIILKLKIIDILWKFPSSGKQMLGETACRLITNAGNTNNRCAQGCSRYLWQCWKLWGLFTVVTNISNVIQHIYYLCFQRSGKQAEVESSCHRQTVSTSAGAHAAHFQTEMTTNITVCYLGIRQPAAQHTVHLQYTSLEVVKHQGSCAYMAFLQVL